MAGSAATRIALSVPPSSPALPRRAGTYHLVAVPTLGSSVGTSLSISRPKASTSPWTPAAAASATVTEPEKNAVLFKTGSWKWKFHESLINVYFEEYEGHGNAENSTRVLMIPTISDVSTVEEWRQVIKDIIATGEKQWRFSIVDWPGLGYSDRPSLDYNADVLEHFLDKFINAPDGPFVDSGEDLVVVAAGHAATIVARAAKKGLIKVSAIVAVAPTWSGPLPIVFGRGSDMESRYGLLRGTLKAPAVGWMMYNLLVSNEKAIRSQYESHVYADSKNVTEDIVKSRYELTKRKGARYVPAAFLTGLLDPVQSREEFVSLFSDLDGKVPVMVVSATGAPKRSKAEMEALRGAKGVSKFVEVPGALLPQEEYPSAVSEKIYEFLKELSI